VSRFVVVALLVLGACGDDDGVNPGDPDAGTWTGDDLAGPCTLATRVGGFTAESGGNAPVVAGFVRDGVLPISVLTESMVMGDCRFLKREILPPCDPACSGSQVCGLDSMCHPYPLEQDVGAVTLDGVASAATLGKDVSNNYSAASPAEPLFAEGALIALHAAGAGTVGAFTLRGVGVAPLVLATNEWVITPGQPFTINWTASGRTDVRVHVRLNVDQHGNSPSFLDCDTGDTGTLTVPAALVDALLGLGQSGVPNAKIQRRTADSVQVGAGCADFVVSTTVPPNQLHVSVEGVDYCTPPMMCPPGKTCNTQTFICE
jgi:hypothetical protein